MFVIVNFFFFYFKRLRLSFILNSNDIQSCRHFILSPTPVSIIDFFVFIFTIFFSDDEFCIYCSSRDSLNGIFVLI